MTVFIYSQLFFYISLVLVTFLPGYFLLLAIFGKSKILNSLEKFIFSFGLSIVIVDFILFAFSGLKIPITKLSALSGILIFSIISLVLFNIRKKKINFADDEPGLFDFSKNQLILVFLLLFLTFFIKATFLSQTISPNSTDLGHHMYWTKWMVENNKLPDYEGMPDFIVGEQTIFGSLALINGLGLFSAFPQLVLYLINLLSILAVFILTLRIFKERNIAIFALFFLGVLYAIAAPQAKYVSGGVVGNIFGNFLMPLAFYFYYRSFDMLKDIDFESVSESRIFLSIAVFLTFGLFYTHHLTAFVFMFVFAFFLILFATLNFGSIENILPKVKKIVISPQVIAVFVMGFIFFFFIFTPNYVNTGAVNTAVGAPSKSTRAGLTIKNLTSSVGGARASLGLIGLLILLLSKKRRQAGAIMIASWALILFLISTQPHLFFINMPSNRIGNYLCYPLSILSAYGLYEIFKNKKILNNKIFTLAFIIIIGFSLSEGIPDSIRAIPKNNDYAALVQTFRASDYLAERTTPSESIIKDHNYIAGDSWMKLFFMRGYKYPLSRGYFKRYEDNTKSREMCTLQMISNPGGDEARNCYQDSGTIFTVVNPRYDSGQFRKLNNFNQVYFSSEIAIYYRTQ